MIATARADGIIQEIREKKGKTGYFIGVDLSVPDPYKEAVHWYRVTILVMEKDIEAARRKLKIGRAINLRHLEITGIKKDDKIFMDLRALWTSVTVRE